MVSIALIVGGFFVSPLGVIYGSVLTAVGLLLLFSVIEKIPEAIKGWEISQDQQRRLFRRSRY
ncbi:MAG: hypothetical protein MJZ67_00175 [Bacteroidales bacterium]|nr:hypothetical protein [Bacteroidales bacterium]